MITFVDPYTDVLEENLLKLPFTLLISDITTERGCQMKSNPKENDEKPDQANMRVEIVI